METLKIVKIANSYIEFNDGSQMTYYHDQDCYEENYADFSQLRDTGIEQETFEKPLRFEKVPNSGFRFGNIGKMYFVPCYSVQNGYYNDQIEIYYKNRCILNLQCETIDEDEDYF